MKKVILYIATSLDGYIADNTGGVNWLAGEKEAPPEETSYIDFVKDIDTVILGWNTFNQIVTELSVDLWPYFEMNSYVMTNKKDLVEKMIDDNIGNTKKYKEQIILSDENVSDLINKLKNENGKNIWICGGANVVNQLIKLDLIDSYNITIIPTILGKGIKLFDNDNKKIDLKLINTKIYNGIVEVKYERR